MPRQSHCVLLTLHRSGSRTTASPRSRSAPDTAEPGSVEEIARATTEARFLSPWVSYLPASATVVSPRAFLHRIAGAPGELVNSATAYAYCRALAASSPRVRMFTIGRSEEGRDIVMLAIADEQGIQDLERLKAATAALADPRKTDAGGGRAADRHARARSTTSTPALHSDETGSTESMLELAYRLAVSEQPMIRRIRENVVVLINPVSNPDGRDKQVEWFYRYLKGKTDLATLPRQAPPYWSKYAFVDINRDAHQLVHETTKAVFRMFFDWHPQMVHDLHESMALLMTWNGTGPFNEHVDPITYAELLELSFHEVQTHDRLRHARACGPGISATTSRTCTWIRSASTTTPTAAATRPSATAPPRRCVPEQPGDESTRRVVSAAAAAAPKSVQLVGTRQRQLQRDRRARRPR